MAAICTYEHKKFNLKSEAEYSHKKFGLHQKKRNRDNMEEDKENIITAQSILEKALKDKQPEEPQAKRRQVKPLFRPWEKSESSHESEEHKKESVPKVLSNIPINVMTYHPNMIRQHIAKPRTEKEQQRRNRNTVACLISRRKKQAEQLMLQQQYITYQQHQAAVMEQSVRAALYLRHLQQIALQRQQSLFVFGPQY